MKNINIDNVDKNIKAVGPDTFDPTPQSVPGCLNPNACNYNPEANYDDSSCIFINENCIDLSGEDYGNTMQNGCNLEPLVKCEGCYYNDGDFPQYVGTTETGYDYEWCEYCPDPNAFNYEASKVGDDDYTPSYAMCVYKKCMDPNACNEFIATSQNIQDVVTQIQGITDQPEADNFLNDTSLCVYATDSCSCNGDGLALNDGYCGDCNGETYFQEGLEDGYCGCGGQEIAPYCNCDGDVIPENSACDCNDNILPEFQDLWCDCNKTNPKSPLCGCDGTSTGTDFATLSANYTTTTVTSNSGGVVEVYQNNNACNCDGTLGTPYYLDTEGIGYGWINNIIYVCPDKVDQIVISTPAAPVAGGYSTSQSDCPPDTMDCNNECSSNYMSAYGTSIGAQANECGQCISPSAQVGNWEEDCCLEDPNVLCPLCPDDFNADVIGATKLHSVQEDSFTISVIASTGNVALYPDVCKCSNIPKNYIDNGFNLVTNFYKTTECDACMQRSSETLQTVLTGGIYATDVSPDLLVHTEYNSDGTVADNTYYCNCQSYNTGVSIDPNTQCCNGFIKNECDGKCYAPEDTSGPVDLGCGCNEPGPSNYDCGCPGEVTVDGMIEDGKCDCEENVDYGCGCNNAQPNACNSCNGDTSCYGCTDPNATNYDASKTQDDNSCVYLTNTVGGLISSEITADAIGDVVDSNNFEKPFTITTAAGEWSEFTDAVGQELATYYEAYNTNGSLLPNFESLSPAVKEVFSKPSEIFQNEFLFASGGTLSRINTKVQVVSPTNLKIVCENPQLNGVVVYKITNNTTQEFISVVGYGYKDQNLLEYYNTLNIQENYSIEIDSVSYYFRVSEDVELAFTDFEEIFDNVIPNGVQIKDMYGLVYWSEFGFNGIGNIDQTSTTLSLGDSNTVVPVYNVYQILALPPNSTGDDAEFVIDFNDIPGLIPPPPVLGCMDVNACNYSVANTQDDGSCYYAEEGYYCDGSQIEVLGCTDPSAYNYDSNANTNDGSCEYQGCTNPEATNYDLNATMDDGSCIIPPPCDGIPPAPICCQDGFDNSSNAYTIVDGIAVANEECDVCQDTHCFSAPDPMPVCCDETATNLFTGDWIDGVHNCGGNCNYPVVTTPGLHIRTKVFGINNLSQPLLNGLKWIVYGPSANIIIESPVSNLSSITDFSFPGDTTVYSSISNETSLVSEIDCLQLLPIGYQNNPIWDYVVLEIVHNEVVISGLYGNNTPHSAAGRVSNGSTNGSMLIQTNPNVECKLGCTKSLDVIQSEYCEYYLKKDVEEFTELFLFVTTSQANLDYSDSYIEVYNINTGGIILRFDTIENSSVYKERFIILKDTTIGIKVKNSGPIQYKLMSEYGDLITIKNIS